MASREVILREDVPNLGHTGDVVRVRPGYARNYLLPRGLAVDASHRNLRMLEHEKRVLGAKAERQRQAAEGIKAKLDGLLLTVRARAGETGRLFGSVTNIDIERLLAERGFSIERRRILLPDPIKDLGTHPVVVQIGGGVRATIQVTVEAEVETETTSE
ncbi:MAG TPA: 50S ribosomal protein L9 [Candidatus Limnocylindria bacterium]|nr:50S ribosomal protein L9 [Candidatus Limnocylindria bacterium]